MIGLSQQALSYRREAQDNDYLHKHYADRAYPEEDLDGVPDSTCVKMERDYLRAWYIFEREVKKIQPRIERAINQSSDDLEG